MFLVRGAALRHPGTPLIGVLPGRTKRSLRRTVIRLGCCTCSAAIQPYFIPPLGTPGSSPSIGPAATSVPARSMGFPPDGRVRLLHRCHADEVRSAGRSSRRRGPRVHASRSKTVRRPRSLRRSPRPVCVLRGSARGLCLRPHGDFNAVRLALGAVGALAPCIYRDHDCAASPNHSATSTQFDSPVPLKVALRHWIVTSMQFESPSAL
jgi:hypothetical protein